MTRSPATVLSELPDGARIVTGGGCGTPTGLLRTLGEIARADRRWELWSGLLLGPLDFLVAVRASRLDYRTWHVVRETRSIASADPKVFVPIRGADVPGVLAKAGVDAVLVRVSPPDEQGWCSLGTSPSYVQPLVSNAGMVLAEVDPTMPRTRGRSSVHVSAFRAMEPAQDATPEYISAPADAVARAIAANILPLLPSDPTLQLGIGAIPESLASLLVSADLGSMKLVGMATDHVVDLASAGRLTAGPGPAVAAIELMGTRKLLDWADGNSSVSMCPVTEVAAPALLASRERLISIISAVQVDLTGQCNLEWARHQISGVGGAMDFFEGARASPGGLRIIAMPASAGVHSRIVDRLPAGAPVSIPRHSVDVVVTEFGVAELSGRSLPERAEALRSISHPDHVS